MSTPAAPVWFMADLHLDPSRPEITRQFLDCLASAAPPAKLYILGDLFEAWIGDDDDQPLGEQVAAGLRRLSTRGSDIYFIHGNRDFLLGQAFAQRAGMQLLAEHTVIQLDGIATLIMHGDTLCTDDLAYQTLRRQVRDPAWHTAVLSRSLAERRQLAASLRSESETALQDKPDAIMDVNPDAVAQVMAEYGVQQLVHGHTHRPAFHDLQVVGQPARRLVLGAWYHRGSILCQQDGNWHFLDPLPGSR